MRKVAIELKVKIQATLDEGVEVQEFVNELNYDFFDGTAKGDVTDQEITGHEVLDSK